METTNNELQSIKKLVDECKSSQSEIRSRVESYLVDILRKFNDDFIEFDSTQKEHLRYNYTCQTMTLVAVQLEYYNSPYVGLTFEDDYGNSFDDTLGSMTIEQIMCIVDNINDYIKKYGYKNSNDMDAE